MRVTVMSIEFRPLFEVNHDAIRLLAEKIGIVDTFRFVNQFTTGHGDYTVERDARFGHLTLTEIVSAIEKLRRSVRANRPGNGSSGSAIRHSSNTVGVAQVACCSEVALVACLSCAQTRLPAMW